MIIQTSLTPSPTEYQEENFDKLSKQSSSKRYFENISDDSSHQSPEIKKPNVRDLALSDSELNSTNELNSFNDSDISLNKAAENLANALSKESPNDYIADNK